MLGNLRHSFAGAALLLLGACSSSGSSDNNYAQFYQLIKQSLAASFGKVKITRDQAAAIPYASLAYSIDHGNQSMLVLATQTGDDLLWTSPTHVVIVTRKGRIIRTVGLGRDLGALTSNGKNQTSPAAAVQHPFSSTRLEDFPDMGLFGIQLSCHAQMIGRQKIEILGQSIKTFRVDETCHADGIKWSFVDSYWLDEDSGIAWRSVQHIHPKAGFIEIETLRPPA